MKNIESFLTKYAEFFAERFIYSTAEVEKSEDKNIKKNK